MEEALAALSASALGRSMRGSLWLYPVANALHVLAAATVFGMILATDLRVLGLGRTLPADALLRFTLPWVWGAFALSVITGVMLFSADPRVVAANPFFRVKLALLLAAGANAFAFHLARRRGARLVPIAALSIALWLTVLVCGRAIAYW
jgi:hypothetical protein